MRRATLAATAALIGTGVAAAQDDGRQAALWHDGRSPRPAARALAAALDTLDRDGLRPEDYAASRIRRLLADPTPDSLLALERLLTAAARAAAHDLAGGRFDPAALDTLWSRDGAPGAEPPPPDGVLAAAAAGQDPVAALARYAPPGPEYAALRRVLAGHRAVAALGGWPPIVGSPALGDTGAAVVALRIRLRAEGDLAGDGPLAAALARYQARHGLTPSGRADPATVAELNVPAAARARQVAANLERWRWAARARAARSIEVNIAAFALTLRVGGRDALTSRVVVGRAGWPTPLTTGLLRSVVFAPAWTVPREIAVREILPELQRDSGYLARHRMRVVGAGDAWQIVQSPGPTNPLGGVKLVFWNPFNVALHATPERRLFREDVPAFSHGCVRVEGARALAEALLAGHPAWPADSVGRAMADTVERVVMVPPGTVVAIGYWTVWVDAGGQVQYRRDVYGWDAKLLRALGR